MVTKMYCCATRETPAEYLSWCDECGDEIGDDDSIEVKGSDYCLECAGELGLIEKEEEEEDEE